MVQSGYESAEEWEILKRLNNSLMAREKLNRRQMQILCMIEPIINRYRQFDSGDVTQDPVKMSRIRAELERGNVGNNQSERERGSKK
jgi:hypothetical protein